MTITRRRFLQAAAGVGAVAALRTPAALAGLVGGGSGGVWLAGDFHCHTIYSGDVWSGPGDTEPGWDEFYTYGHTPGEQIALAEARGLDFLAITDHNDVTSSTKADYRSDRLVLVPGYEHSLSGGHAGVFVPSLDRLSVVTDAAGGRAFPGDDALAAFLGLVAERDGIVVLNHPFYKGARERRSWTYGEAVSDGVAAVEAWNAAWLLRYETSPLYDANNDMAVQWWEAHFARRRAMVGGSDNHWKTLDFGAGVGQPTTWVYAADRSTPAILDAVRAGRTFVSAQPPLHAGTQVFLSAVEEWPGGGGAAVVGDTVRALGPLRVRARVVNGQGAALRFVSTGMVVHERRLVLPDETVEATVVLPTGGSLRAEVYDHAGLVMRALTSAIGAAGNVESRHRRDVTVGPPVSYDLFLPPGPADPATLAAARVAPACECTA